MSNAAPSRNPANDDTLTGLFRTILDKFIQNTDDMLPARVVAFDRDANRVSVQPMIKVVATNGQSISRAQVINLPVMQFGGGGCVMLFNLNPGDLGWIKANDRDISLFLQAYAEAPPNTLRKHSFSDAVFFPDVMRGWTLAGEDADAAVLQTLDGAVRISLNSTRIKMTANGSTLTFDSSSVVSSVPIHAPDFVTPSVATYNGHTHPGISPGPSSTGAPNP